MSAFLFETTCKSLVHKLGCVKMKSTKELLDITTNHASGEEAVSAIFVKEKTNMLTTMLSRDLIVARRRSNVAGSVAVKTTTTMTRGWSW
jgi:hypothetical protein